MLIFYRCIGVAALFFLVGCSFKETYISSSYHDVSPGEALIFIEKATALPEFQGKVSLSEVTQGVVLAFQRMGANIVDSKEEADYVVSIQVVDLTDLFDNIVHIHLDVKSAYGGETVYRAKHFGDGLTQSYSISQMSLGIQNASPEIYASINKHYAERGAKQVADASSVDSFVSTMEPIENKSFQSTPKLGVRCALVVGNGAYRLSPLKNPIRDARDVSASLRRLGFTVIQKNNASLREMEATMNQFYATLKQGGIGLFYYAGHGIQVEGRNYLVPVDARIDSESDVKFECLDAGRVLGKMEDAGNAMNIVILDACRNNPFARSFRSTSRGLARMDAPTGSILAYSTAPGSVAADGSGRNSVYTKHLLQHMRTPGLDINTVFIKTRMDVIQETDGKQVPWESSSLTGLFYFIDQEAGQERE